MPELPEVETIVRDLDKKLRHKIIVGIKALDKKIFQITKRQVKDVIGKEIKSVNRRAKMIIFNLGNHYLIFHLKMTGQLVLKEKNAIVAGGHPIVNQGKDLPNKFSRVIFKFNDESRLYFNDLRRFGWVKLCSIEEFQKLNEKLGVEPLSPDFTLENFIKALARRKHTTIKQLLMEQQRISGIGNIYADESLYQAGIKPFRRNGTLKKEEIKKLWLTIPKILDQAIKHRGTSFSDFVDAQGRNGNFIRFLKVYGRAGEKCKECGRIIRKNKINGRGTHWCDFCQN